MKALAGTKITGKCLNSWELSKIWDFSRGVKLQRIQKASLLTKEILSKNARAHGQKYTIRVQSTMSVQKYTVSLPAGCLLSKQSYGLMSEVQK